MIKRNAMLISALSLSAILGATGAYAYYSAQTATTENTFSIVAGGTESNDDAGQITEIFDPEEAKDLEPRSEFKKEVQLHSNVDYSSYAYILVTIPQINGRLASDSEKKLQDAVSLNINTSAWTLVNSTAGSASVPAKYLYRCKNILAAGADTEKLFTKASVADFVESDGASGTIDVTGYMLSAVNVTEAEADADAKANFFS